MLAPSVPVSGNPRAQGRGDGQEAQLGVGDMLGLLVSELIRMVEMRHGEGVADALMFDTDMPPCDPESALDGYPSAQIEALLAALAHRTQESPHQLMQELASRLARRIRQLHPEVHAENADLLDPLERSAEGSDAVGGPASEFARDEIGLLFRERSDVLRLVDGLQQGLARSARIAGRSKGAAVPAAGQSLAV